MSKSKLAVIVFITLLLSGGALWLFLSEERNGRSVKIENAAPEEKTEQELSAIPVENEKEIFPKEEGQPQEASEAKKSQSPAPEKKQEDAPALPEEKKAQKEDGGSGWMIKDRSVSWGFARSAQRSVDTVVVHSSYNSLGGDKYDTEKIIAIYKSYGVAAHYLIGREGDIRRLVKEDDIAYHAGESRMPDGRSNVNVFSIGIELVGDLESGFTKEQYGALNFLLADIKKRHEIKYVLGHEDIAPGRKTDPWKIEWDKVRR